VRKVPKDEIEKAGQSAAKYWDLVDLLKRNRLTFGWPAVNAWPSPRVVRDPAVF